MTEKILTASGAAKIRAELAELTGVKRAELAARLREAIKMGDLSENADYIMAKEEQAFLEGRILELETLLRTAVIVPDGEPAEDGVAAIGRTVTIQEIGGEPETFLLVGANEADPRNGRISNESPIGKALLGKRVGEEAVANTPVGQLRFRILKVE